MKRTLTKHNLCYSLLYSQRKLRQILVIVTASISLDFFCLQMRQVNLVMIGIFWLFKYRRSVSTDNVLE